MGGDEHHEQTEAVRAGLSEEVTSRQRGGRCGWSRGSQGGGGQGDSQELEFQPTFVSHLSQGDHFSGNGQERDLQAGHKVCTAVKNGKRCKAAAPSQLRPLDGGRRAVWGGGLHPACHPPCCSLRSPVGRLTCPRPVSVQQGHRLPFVCAGLPGGASGCRLFLEWDGPGAGAPGEAGREPSRRTRSLRLRGKPQAPGPLAAKWTIWDANPGLPTPKPTALSPACQGQV